jgi:small-conductance mechanosensitive channel
MGKSFNDDIFNNNFNIDSINGLNISKEAIEENKEKSKPKIDLSNINIDEVKKAVKEEKKKEKQNTEEELEQLKKEEERIKESNKEYEQMEKYIQEEEKATFIKKTMIFKQEYLDIIDGLAEINDMQIKDVLNQLLERSINQLDEKVREKALKTGRKTKSVKTTKNIF